MEDQVIRIDYPWWVRMSLWGVPGGRAGQWFAVGLSLACAVACVVYGLWDARFFSGVLFVMPALMYWLTIQWIDRHGSWEGAARPGTIPDRGALGSMIMKVFACSVVVLLLALIVVRKYLIDYYQVPQNGMYPGVSANSRVVAFKQAYTDPASVNRGDIVVFVREVNGQSTNFIWRVIGLPGERIETSGESLAIDGRPVERQPIREADGKAIFREQFGDVAYEVAYDKSPTKLPPEASLTLAADQFFVMGDNRYEAFDSRYFGPISFDSIVAKRIW